MGINNTLQLIMQTAADLANLFRTAAAELDDIPPNVPVVGDVNLNFIYRGSSIDVEVAPGSNEVNAGVRTEVTPLIPLWDAFARVTAATVDDLEESALALVNDHMRNKVDAAISLQTTFAEAPKLFEECVPQVQQAVNRDLSITAARLRAALARVHVTVTAVHFTDGKVSSVDYQVSTTESV